MIPKPAHLGPEYAAQFQDHSVIAAYHHRPPYPAEVFDILVALVADDLRTVLDVGCGTGDIARGLAPCVERVDAVDISAGMIEKGGSLPGGDRSNLRWIHGRAEDAPLEPPYALVTAGASLHWMAWDVVLPRFRDLLSSRGFLAIVERVELPSPWDAELRRIIPRFSTNRAYQPYDLVHELERRDLFQRQGEWRTAPVLVTQPVDDYVESFHSWNGFSRDRMTADAAAAFDAAAKRLVAPFSQQDRVELRIMGKVVWGRPVP